ncbi:glycosyltransferase family 39 protein [Leptolyngbya sp. AN02str]|uniref:glycosyltransferase family 39 protein n=1 Tax=Leptolyngbya sp. AN02str TaxID=3423363 RepID=UPI003D32001F
MNGRDWKWLVLWIGLGAVLRFANLADKPVWTDEFSTIVFGLGNSYRTIPLNQVISFSDLVAPLVARPTADVGDVVQNLLTESNHPPLYFVLTHLWVKLFGAGDGVVSIWLVRSLAAVFGVLTIPAMFGLGWLTWRSPLVAQLAAALTAVSPFGIYLAQEARHYTLPTLWVIASLACLVIALQHIHANRPIPLWVCGLWIVVNGLGVATHYFFVLTLAAEGLAIVGLAIAHIRMGKPWPGQVWRRFAWVLLGTIATTLVWLPFVQGIGDSELTQWIYRRNRQGFEWLEPLGQLLASSVTMLYLLPIQSPMQWLSTVSQVALVVLLLWSLPWMVRGWVQQERDRPVMLQALGGFVVGAIALFLINSYGFSRDLTSAFRYSFVYYPAVLLLVAVSLNQVWIDAPSDRSKHAVKWWLRGRGRTVVVTVLVLGCVGSMAVVSNLAYQKTHRPERMVAILQQEFQAPTLLAMSHLSHGQTGRMMGLALEWHRQNADLPEPQVLLAQDDSNREVAIATLQTALQTQPRPLNLWAMNFEATKTPVLDAMLLQMQCVSTSEVRRADGYRAQRYHCSA